MMGSGVRVTYPAPSFSGTSFTIHLVTNCLNYGNNEQDDGHPSQYAYEQAWQHSSQFCGRWPHCLPNCFGRKGQRQEAQADQSISFGSPGFLQAGSHFRLEVKSTMFTDNSFVLDFFCTEWAILHFSLLQFKNAAVSPTCVSPREG